MATIVFPGQGSQTKGMGGSLFLEFSELIQKADQILGYSLESLCLEDPDEQLNQTKYTQPALFVLNALSYLKKLKDTGKKPTYVAGHSLGEYNALLAAEVFDFETGLKLVQKRGDLMSKAMGGGMAAVIGLKSEAIQTILQEQNLTRVSIANYNSHTQIVISGPKEDIEATEPLFIKAGAMLFIPLKVSGAFHSSFMQDAAQEFSNFLQKFSFSPPTIPVIANVNAKPYQANEVQANLTKQITHSVLWRQSIEYLIQQGETVFEETGPGKVLAGLIRRIQQGQ